MSPEEKSISSKDMVGNKPAFSWERVVEMERPMRSTFLLGFLLVKGGMWYNTKNFPKRFSRIQKRRMKRSKATYKRQLIDVLDKTLLEEAMELEKVKE